MDFVKLLLITTLASIILGQLIRIPILTLAITVSDITTLLLIISFLIYTFTAKRKINIPFGIFTLFLVFSLVAATSTILATARFTTSQIAQAALFELRFITYFLVSIVVLNIVAKNQVSKWANLLLSIGVVFTAIGFLQYITVPDLSFLVPFGWDPHQKRLVSTFLDPNFAGIALVILSSISISLFLFKKKYIYLALTFIYFIGIILTFSRSSYLALLISLTVIGVLKSPKFLAISLTIFIFAILVNTQARERIAGAIAIDETTQARLASYQKALTIASRNPLFGVGFNTYRYAQSEYGFFSQDEPSGGHSGGGSDSSFLLVLATTGAIGSVAFILFILSIAKKLAYKTGQNYIKLATLSALLAIIVHSQFVNSFFYPQIMILIWFTLGLVYVAGKNP